MSSEIKYALRNLARMPGLAAVVILSLGIGIGVNTAVFSWLESRVLRPLPAVRDSRHLQLVEARAATGGYPGLSWLERQDLQSRLPAFRELLASRMVSFNVGEPGRVERTTGSLVSGNYFTALGLEPVLGRFFTEADVVADRSAPVAVVSHGFWQSRLGGSADVVGRTIRVNGVPLAIVAVAPAAFQGTTVSLTFDLWLPATLAPRVFEGSRELDDRRIRGYETMGFLVPGATPREAQAQLDEAMTGLARDHPETNRTLRGEVMPIHQAPRGPQRFIVMALGTLQGLMLLLLGAVCGNAATLLLARASSRQHEVAVRLAVGASRWRIVRLVLTESLIVAALSVAVGTVLAVWATTALRDVPLPGGLPIDIRTRVDLGEWVFAALVGLGCTLALGLGPALHLSRTPIAGATRTAGRSPFRTRSLHVLMGGQIALAMAVLIAAGLFLQALALTRETDPGFVREGVWLAAYDLSGRRIDPGTSRDVARRMLARLRDTAGVEAVAIASSVPLDIHGMPSRAFALEGRETGEQPDEALVNTVTPGYFAVMGIPLDAGADFVDLADTTVEPQAIVNDEFVRRFVGGGEVIGRRLEIAGRRYVVSAVAATTKYESFDEPAKPLIYLSYRDRPVAAGEIHVRARGGHVVTAVRQAARDVDSELPLYNARAMATHVEQNLFFARIPARMFAVLGPLLLVLASIGVFAVVAYSVAERTAEIGVRLALGATARRVMSQFLADTLQVVGFGVILGWATAWIVQRELVAAPTDWTVFAGVPMVLLLVAAAAAWWPARRIVAVDPVEALRHE